jgi:hypothetical protein
LEKFKLHYDIKKEENMKKKKPRKEQITAKKKCQKVFCKKIIEILRQFQTAAKTNKNFNTIATVQNRRETVQNAKLYFAYCDGFNRHYIVCCGLYDSSQNRRNIFCRRYNL